MWAISAVITEKITGTLPCGDPCSRHKTSSGDSIHREWVAKDTVLICIYPHIPH